MRRPRPANMLADVLGQLLVGLERHAHHLGDGLAGDVVLGGPSPPQHDDGVGCARAPARRRRHDAVEVVADLGLEERVDPGQGQLLADPRRVGVDDLPEQQLGSDGDDLAAHGGNASGGPRRGAPVTDRLSRRCHASWPTATRVHEVLRGR